MNNAQYNGWTNYESWVVSLWMDNEKGTQTYWHEQASGALKIEGYDRALPEFIENNTRDAAYKLSHAIKDAHEESLPELSGFAADLLNAAMSEVNWYEIARHLVDTVIENEAYEANK